MIPLSDFFIVQPETAEEVDELAADIMALIQLMPEYDSDFIEGIREYPEYLTLIYHLNTPIAYLQIEDSRGYDVGKDSLEFSGAVLPEYRDTGITFALAPAIIRQAFRATGKRKMLAKIDPDNKEAQAAIAALGFQRVEPHPDLPPPDKLIYKITRKQALNK